MKKYMIDITENEYLEIEVNGDICVVWHGYHPGGEPHERFFYYSDGRSRHEKIGSVLDTRFVNIIMQNSDSFGNDKDNVLYHLGLGARHKYPFGARISEALSAHS